MAKFFAHETAIVEEGAEVGEGTKIWHHAHVRSGAKIGKNCVLGKSVYVDKNVKIGNNVKLQNRVSVYDGVTMEDDVFVGPHVTFTNDLYPRAFNESWQIVPTLVKKGASIGAGSVIVCGVTIGEYAMVGAGSVVTKDVPAHALVYGNPARLRGFVCFCGKKLKRVKEVKEDIVVMVCDECGKEVTIPKSLYEKIKE